MMRPARPLALAVLAATLFGLYQMKSAVEAREKELFQARRVIADEKDAIQVLRAEWSYLNQPERLARLARRESGLKPLSGAQLSSLDRAGGKLAVETADAEPPSRIETPPDRGTPPR